MLLPELQIFKPNIDFNNEPDRSILFDQYKLLVDSAHKTDERRKDTNSVFITLNSIFMSTMGYSDRLTDISTKNLVFFIMFVMIGFILSIAWMRIILTYKRINYINYLLLQTFEKHLPSSIFSTRSEIIADYVHEYHENAKNNLILEKETAMPIIFLFIYSVYTLIGLVVLTTNLFHLSI